MLRAKRFEHRHAHGDPHLDLFANERLRAVRDQRVDLDAAVHRPGCMTSAPGLA